MNLGDVVGQLLQEGMSPAAQQRLQHAMGPQGLGGAGGGLDSLIGNLLGGTGGAGAMPQAGAGAGTGAAGGLGGLLGGIGKMLGQSSGVGNLNRGEVGGIGALAGALLGGGGMGSVKGAAGGSAMALLGTLALTALKNYQAGQAGTAEAAPAVSQDEIHQMTSPQTAELCLLGMIEAAKADGNIGPAEMEKIVGKLQEDGGVSDAERQFVMEKFAAPSDVDGLIKMIPNREVAAQVYAAALLAVTLDTPEEQAFFTQLAQGTGLDAATVARLHGLVGAPAAA